MDTRSEQASLSKSKTGFLKILVVDDHPIVYEGLKYLLCRQNDMEICGCAENANAAMRCIEALRPDLVIIDISLKGGMNGIDLIKSIKNLYPQLKTFVISMCDENLYAERVLRAGARGYLMKEELGETIVSAIRRVMAGKIYLSEQMTSKLFDTLLVNQSRKISSTMEKLSDREIEVLRLIGKGYKTHDIAKRLNISTNTIGTHRHRIKNKLNIKDGGRLTRFAIEWSSDISKGG